MAAYTPKFKPKVRTNPLIGSAAYTWDDLGRFHFVTVDITNSSPELIARLQDQRSEHRLGVKKVRLASKFSAPKITDFNTLSDLDGHYQIEKALKLVCINYGMIGAFQILKETAQYIPFKAAHTLQDGTIVAEQAETAPVYATRDMFQLDEKFTEDLQNLQHPLGRSLQLDQRPRFGTHLKQLPSRQ